MFVDSYSEAIILRETLLLKGRGLINGNLMKTRVFRVNFGVLVCIFQAWIVCFSLVFGFFSFEVNVSFHFPWCSFKLANLCFYGWFFFSQLTQFLLKLKILYNLNFCR